MKEQISMNFSVLSSIYYKENVESFHACMRSIWQEQSLLPSEMILVKDGVLTEDLENEIAFWQKELKLKLKVISLDKNIGLGKALNEGLKYCSNEWVLRMDTDDICLPNRFQKQIDFISQYPDITIIGGQIVEFENFPENIIAKKVVPVHHNDIVAYSKKRCPFNHMTVAYRKSVIEAVGGYQDHLLMEDYNLWVRVLAAGYKTANLSDVIVEVRAGRELIGRRRGLRYIKSEWQLFKLKRTLHYGGLFQSFILFFLRATPRILPSFLLRWIYYFLRFKK